MAEADAPAAKRQRTDDSQITRGDIWHDDGSVVLQAEGIQSRVHWTVLSIHSSFFRDMRGLPQPPDQPSIEGCPIIELPDSSTDVGYLLKALYDPLLFKEKSLPFPFIAGIVRMGRKYDFKNLLAAAVERLTYENPTTLEAHDKLFILNSEISGAIGYRSTQIDSQGGLLFDTITLAQENQLFAVLPCAYSRAILFYDQERIFDGLPSSSLGGPPIKLSSLNQRICILGREKMLTAQWQHYWLDATPAEGCTAKTVCAARKNRILKPWATAPVIILSLPHKAEVRLHHGLCSACESSCLVALAEGRKQLWENLPSFFNLSPWNELKNEV